MTAEHFTPPESAARTAAVARRLVTLAMTAAILSLAGCGDSGEDSETDASDTGRRAPAADPAWRGDNGARINATIGRLGTCGNGSRGAASPLNEM
ncbi:MAG: hypothetical protein ACLPLP_14210 [Mycobacterium sp.]